MASQLLFLVGSPPPPKKKEPVLGLSTTSCIRSASRVRREEVKEEVKEHPLLSGCPAQARLLPSDIPEELWHPQEGSAVVCLLQSPTPRPHVDA